MVTAGALAVAAGAAFGVHQATSAPTVTGAAAQGAAQPATFLPRYGQSFGGFSDGTGAGSPWDGTTSGSPSDGTTTGTTAATAAQQVGIVEIDTVLGYQGAQAAGTGMVLTSNGEILTNNHVVDGATSIRSPSSTGATYTGHGRRHRPHRRRRRAAAGRRLRPADGEPLHRRRSRSATR